MNTITPADIDTAFTKVAELLEADAIAHRVSAETAKEVTAKECKRHTDSLKLSLQHPGNPGDDNSKLSLLVCMPLKPMRMISVVIQHGKDADVEIKYLYEEDREKAAK